MAERRPYCSDLSRDNGEPLGATASRVDRWFLIEYRTLWTRDAFAGSGLSDQVKAHLREQVRSVDNGRLLFIRRPDRRRAETLLAFAADSRAGSEHLRGFELEAHDDLRGLDLTDTAAGMPIDHPLFLVCTHGKHDPCCARQGRPLYDGVCEEVETNWVWQVTHIGGDRFAGNLVCLPEGIYYGRAEREDASRLVDEHLEGRLAFDLYRGRSIYAFAVQAAERAIREATGLRGIDELVLRSVEGGEDSWLVSFEAAGEMRIAHVHAEPADLTYLTCNAPTVKRPTRYVVTTRPG
jgi:hypothetical protein